MERAIVFVDGANLHQGLRHCYGINRLKIKDFCEHITQGRDLVKIHYADSPYRREYIPKDCTLEEAQLRCDEQQSYFLYLRKCKSVVFRKGYYSMYTKPPTEKRADVYLATDMVDLCHRDEYDVAYLISGDMDLTPAVDIVVREGKKVINVYFDHPERNSLYLIPHCQGKFKHITRSLAEQFKWVYKKKPEPEGSGDHKSQ